MILLIFIFCAAAFAGARLSRALLGTDFPDFYCAARIVAESHGHQLYDAEVQRQYQARYAGGISTLYNHPPFEAALYLAVAWLPLRHAYLLWSFLSLAFLAAAIRHLAKEELLPWDWRILLAASLTFVPVLLCLVQGQDSLLLLLLVILGFTALRRGRALAAGCWLGLGLFKFHLVVPLVLVLVLTQSRSIRTGIARGFGLVALVLAGLSAAISGWSVFIAYPNFLTHLWSQPFGGISAQAMPNFRGLTFFFFHRDQSPWAVGVMLVLSLGALVMTLAYWRHARIAADRSSVASPQDQFDCAFATAVLFALLASYNLNPHDLSLLLLPLAVLLRAWARTSLPERPARWTFLGLLGILFLPPLHLWALRAGVYGLVSIPMLLLFLFLTSTAGNLTTPATSPGTATGIPR